jgi:tRNA threonylcarbamoyladenosine biosynthesis protein TsaE
VITARTTSVDDTRRLGSSMAGLARPGDVIVLAGDLGAGKTAFAQGFAAGLGVDEPVTSPTFVIARTYEGRLRLHHLDVYRLESMQEAEDVGIAELVDDGAVTLVEWGDVVTPVLPAGYLEVRLTFDDDDGDDDRTVTVERQGKGWAARDRALHEVLAPWLADGGTT